MEWRNQETCIPDIFSKLITGFHREFTYSLSPWNIQGFREIPEK